jgi:hypothetical protein
LQTSGPCFRPKFQNLSNKPGPGHKPLGHRLDVMSDPPAGSIRSTVEVLCHKCRICRRDVKSLPASVMLEIACGNVLQYGGGQALPSGAGPPYTLPRDRLQFLLESVSDEKLRVEIKSCLDRNQLEEMTVLFERQRITAGQKTPEERLALLLESLRPYCSSEEFGDHRDKAFAVLQLSGFRQAREFAVGIHDELREKLKKAAEDTPSEDLKHTA